MDRLAILGGKPVSDKKIPLAKPVFSQKDADDVAKVLRSGYVRMGPYTKEFEEKYAERVGAKYAYAVSNGTAALHVAYLSTLKPGDEVIAPAFTFIATVSTVFFSNAKPVFADIDAETYLIDPEDVKEKITSRTRAIAPVHLFGNAADMDALTEIAEDHKLLLINDCAQAHGTKYDGRDLGSWEHLNCYSFYPTKTMTTGEGGMVTTNDPELYRLGTLIRNHGDDGRYHHVMLGLNYRMTDIMAVIGLNQLENLDGYLRERRYIGEKLRRGIEEIDCVSPQKITPKTNPSFSYFSATLDLEKLKCTRDEFLKALHVENIDCGVHYPTPLTRQLAILDLMKPDRCPVSEDVANRIFSLPMHPYLSDDDLDAILNGVKKVTGYYHR
jgi:perosamine synthetase